MSDRRPLRIGIDYRPAANRPYAGIGQTVRELVAALAAIDHPHELVLYSDRPVDAPPQCRVRLGPTRVGSVPGKIAWHLWCAADVGRGGVDVFLATSSLFMSFVRPSLCVVFVHDLSALHLAWTHTPKVRWITRIALGRSVRGARAVVTNSDFTRADLSARFGLAPGRVRTAHLGLGPAFRRPPDAESRRRARAALGLPERFILAVNTLEPRKNVSRLLRAHAILEQRGRLPHGLVIVGKPGWLQDGIAAEAGREVLFTGFVPDEHLPAVYAEADLFVMPSLFEGFGLPLLEAMAMGVPIVTSPISAMPEVAGDAALYADPHSPEDIAAKMTAVLEDPPLADRLRAAGQARVGSFTWDSCARQVLGAIEGGE